MNSAHHKPAIRAATRRRGGPGLTVGMSVTRFRNIEPWSVRP
jgi:hypothetical protein